MQEVPLTTGQRVLDLFFPPREGAPAPSPVVRDGQDDLLQQIAKWCDAQVIVYVGCGNAGNEMSRCAR